MIMPKKIFQIGFNKCGTCSIDNLFNYYVKPPLSSIHWNYGYLAYTIYNNIISGNRLPLTGYDKYSVFTDMECFIEDDQENVQYISIYKDFFDLLEINYQPSICILNTRNIDNWIKSRLNHRVLYSPIKNGKTNKLYKGIMYIDLFKKIYNTNNEMDITDIWKKEWIEHHDNVQQYFQLRPHNLLVYNIEVDSFDKVVKFFRNYNIEFTINKMPHENRTK